jgi:hypothetical protein
VKPRAAARPRRALPARLEDLPNVGPAIARDLRRLGIGEPDELRGRDPYMLYLDLCRTTRALQDPCVLDTFIAAVRYAEGGPAKPWWHYTAERKRLYPGGAKALAARTSVAPATNAPPASRARRGAAPPSC